MTEAQPVDAVFVRRLTWLLDAPLFVDDTLVERLFDAVVRPTYEVQTREVGEVSEHARRTLFGGQVEAGYKLGLPFLTGTLDTKATVKGDRERSSKHSRSTKLVEAPVVTSGRRLEEIALVYISEHPDRIVRIDTDGSARTFAGETLDLARLAKSAEDPPRMLAFIAVPPGSQLIPMAAELQSGRTALLFEDLIKHHWKDNEAKPVYPHDRPTDVDGRRAYWEALSSRFSSQDAMGILEKAVINDAEKKTAERIGWIDFRLPIGTDDLRHALHLHLVPDGRYHTGVFGYNFIRRGDRQGLRIVGTLKAGLDVNVLAVFDR